MNNIRDYLNLLSKSSDSIYFCPNPGNAGDSLITAAAFQLLKECDVRYQLCSWKDLILEEKAINPEEAILIYSGGGHIVNNYFGPGRKILEKFHKSVRKFVILPHTINTHEDLLKELGSNVEIICREQVSYSYIREKAPKAKVMLMDDLAFSLNVDKILEVEPVSLLESVWLKSLYKLGKDSRADKIPSIKAMLDISILEAYQSIGVVFGRKDLRILNGFRTDGEKTGINLPKGNLDLSKIFKFGHENEAIAYYSSYRLLKFINSYDEVRTNRLHIAIAGALLEKQVKFYANSYYKCKAVYEFSMKERFLNVTWMN